MRTFFIVLIAAACLGAAENPSQNVAGWVEELGGSVARGADGSITEIDLGGSWVTDIDLDRLEAVPSLRRLDLSQTHITDIGLDAIGRLPQLESLSLFFCEHVTEAGVARLKDLPKLERLNLRGTSVSDSGMGFLAQITSLKSLDIGITQITGPSLESLESLVNLEEIAIGGMRVSDLGLSYLQSLPNLRKLDVSGAQITDSGVWGVMVTDVNVESIAQLSSLEELILAASDQEYIDNIGDGVPRVRQRVELTDIGVAKLTGLENLRRLDLSRAEVTAKGLAELAKLPALETLKLAYAPLVDGAAAEALAGLKGLRALDLAGTAIGDAELAKLPAVETLVAVDTEVTAAGAEEFSKRRPDCNLIW